MNRPTRTRAARLVPPALVLGAVAACAGAILWPQIDRRLESSRQGTRVDRLLARAELARPVTAHFRGEAPLAHSRATERLAPLTEEARSVPALDGADLSETFPLALEPLHPDMTSWSSVGGCGVGGGGGGGGARWMGRRSPAGYLIEVEMMSSFTLSGVMDASSLTTKLSTNIEILRLNASLSIPSARNVGPDDNYEELFGVEQDWTVSGLGDLSLMLNRKLGLEGNTSVGLNIGLPTGEHDETSPDGSYTLPRSFQLGKGVTTYAGTLEHTFNKDWGMITVGGGLNLNGGENDIDNRTGDTYDLYTYVGYRTEFMVHSAGVKLSRGLSKDINNGSFEADQSRTEVTLQYGLELGYLRTWPMFVALTATLAEDSSDNTSALAFGVVTSY